MAEVSYLDSLWNARSGRLPSRAAGAQIPESCPSRTATSGLVQRPLPRDRVDTELRRHRIGDRDLGIGDGDLQLADSPALLQNQREQLTRYPRHLLPYRDVEGVVVAVGEVVHFHFSRMTIRHIDGCRSTCP